MIITDIVSAFLSLRLELKAEKIVTVVGKEDE